MGGNRVRCRPSDFLDAVYDVVNHMRLPSWYSREEGYSTGFLAVIEKLSAYEIKKKSGKLNCNVQTYVRHTVRWAVLKEINKIITAMNRCVSFEKLLEIGVEDTDEEED